MFDLGTREQECSWRDRGASADRDRWFAQYRPDGPRAARFPCVVVPGAAGQELTDSLGDELCERAVRELANGYAEFHAEMTLWRRHLVGPAGGPEEPDDDLEAPPDTGLWLRVLTEGYATRAFSHTRLDRFRTDAWSTGVFSVLPDLDQAVVLAAARGEGTRDRGPALTAEVSWESDEEVRARRPVAAHDAAAPVTDAALRSMVGGRGPVLLLPVRRRPGCSEASVPRRIPARRRRRPPQRCSGGRVARGV